MISYTPEKLIEWDISELWNVFYMFLEEKDDNGRKHRFKYENELKQVRDGIMLKFPIQKITNDFVEHRPTFNTVLVQGIGKFKDVDYFREIEDRKFIIRDILLDNYVDDISTRPRV